MRLACARSLLRGQRCSEPSSSTFLWTNRSPIAKSISNVVARLSKTPRATDQPAYRLGSRRTTMASRLADACRYANIGRAVHVVHRWWHLCSAAKLRLNAKTRSTSLPKYVPTSQPSAKPNRLTITATCPHSAIRHKEIFLSIFCFSLHFLFSSQVPALTCVALIRGCNPVESLRGFLWKLRRAINEILFPVASFPRRTGS